jgi:hypothetical protein
LDLLNSLIRDRFSEDKAREDIGKVEGQQIKAFLTDYASDPHMAGLEADEKLAEKIKEKWDLFGLDQVVNHWHLVQL